MALFQRRNHAPEIVAAHDVPAVRNGHDPQPRGREAYYELKTRIHRQLIERLDLAKLELLPLETVQQQIRRIVEDLLVADETPLSRQERERIVVTIGRRIDESSPMVDARLTDGSRVNAIIPPLALDGPVLSIRRFAADPYRMKDLIEFGTVTPALAEILRAAVQARLNILVSGGTGAGKTTMLNVLSNAIPNNERIVTIEDSAELQLQQEHIVRLETRPPNMEGAGAVTQRDLVRNALRMRPDRIVLGEVRGAEVLDMLQAMNTGHDGSLSTVHANSTRDALSRIETMVLMSGLSLPVRAMRDYVASALDLVVHVSRLSDGTRKVVRVTEIVGMEEDVVTTQDIFTFDQEGIDSDGRVVGFHRATGVRPKFTERLARAGIPLGSEVFDPSKRHADDLRHSSSRIPVRRGPGCRGMVGLPGEPQPPFPSLADRAGGLDASPQARHRKGRWSCRAVPRQDRAGGPSGLPGSPGGPQGHRQRSHADRGGVCCGGWRRGVASDRRV